jgi:hypothetical protein
MTCSAPRSFVVRRAGRDAFGSHETRENDPVSWEPMRSWRRFRRFLEIRNTNSYRSSLRSGSDGRGLCGDWFGTSSSMGAVRSGVELLLDLFALEVSPQHVLDDPLGFFANVKGGLMLQGQEPFGQVVY